MPARTNRLLSAVGRTAQPLRRRSSQRGGLRSVLFLVLALLALSAGALVLAAWMGVPQARRFVGTFVPLGPGDDPLSMVPLESTIVLSVDVTRLRQVPLLRDQEAADLPGLGDTGLPLEEFDSFVLAGDLAVLIESAGEEPAFVAVGRLARDIPPAEQLERLREEAGGEVLESEFDGLPGVTLLDEAGIPLVTAVPVSERYLVLGQGSWLAATIAAARGRLPGGLSPALQEACEPAERDEPFWACTLREGLPPGADEQLDSEELGPLAPPFSAEDVSSALLTADWDDLAGLELVLWLAFVDETTAAGAAGWLKGVVPMAGLALGPSASGLSAEQEGEAARVRLALSPEQVEQLAGRAAEAATGAGLLAPDAAAVPSSPPPRRPEGRTVRTVRVLRDGVAYGAPEGEPVMRVRAGEEYPLADYTLDNWYRLGNTPAGVEAWLPDSAVELDELVITDGIGSPSDLR